MIIRNPLCIALDTPDVDRAVDLARRLKPYVGCVKIGMEFFYANGARGYEAVAREGVPIFLDLKLHDIPNTVAQGLSSLMRLAPPPIIINVHASGGLSMMKAAAEIIDKRSKIIAVTILTSLADDDIWQAGFDHTRSTRTHARNLAELAQSAGLDGVVCSSHDVAAIRHVTGPDFLTVVPGIRPESSASQDQKRVATPAEAIAAGADILVIGRAIMGTEGGTDAVKKILDSINAR